MYRDYTIFGPDHVAWRDPYMIPRYVPTKHYARWGNNSDIMIVTYRTDIKLAFP